ncbi:YbdD/YjiX family protein [Burkholderiaceae bacterium DAT-1]|nr:YbdD/YjiX family protein [Burkholderiaceae bacterium DAT-1]
MADHARSGLLNRIRQGFRLMVGVHDYDAYLAHMQLAHPDAQPMSKESFFRACMDARYPGKSAKVGKCPC